MSNKGLTQKQAVFVLAYLRTWNASEAAREAGYANPAQLGYQLLHKTSVVEAVKARIAEKAMSADEVLLRLADQARSSMVDFLDVDQERLDLDKARDAGKLHLVKKFSRTDTQYGGSISIELYDAQAALVQLGKHHGLFVERHEHSGTIDVNEYRDTLARKLDSIAAANAAASVPIESHE